MTQTFVNRIGIDCRLSGKAHAGIGRYIEELILRLPLLAPQIEWVLFFADQRQAHEYLLHFPHRPANIKIVLIPVRHYSISEQLFLPRIFAQEKLDLLHVPHFNAPIWYRQPLVVTIHDLLWHEFTGLNVTTLNPILYLIKYFAYRFIVGQTVNQAQKIIVPAHTIAAAVISHYPKLEAKVVVTPEGSAEAFATHHSADSQKTAHKQLLYVGSLYPHKNIKVVLAALRDLPDYKLKIVGSRNIFQDQTRELVAKLGVTNQVEFAGYLSDRALAATMSESLALVQPSLSEGFGLTGIEAMAAGLAVVASKIPIFQEIYQDGAIFFDPHSPSDLGTALWTLAKTNQSQLRKRAQRVIKQYSWDKMAKQTLAVYQSA